LEEIMSNKTRKTPEGPRKILLAEERMPRTWYNVLPDLPHALDPPLHPATGAPLAPDDLLRLFPRALLDQETSAEAEIEIPAPVLDALSMWRPTPLFRARGLEAALGCAPARIYYKDESVSPAGSHKPNTAVAQAFYNKEEGISRLATETGAGQWGSALAFACGLFGVECKVFMVRSSYAHKPYRRTMMELWGASCIASPSPETASGRAALARDPATPGSLGIAISEAVECALSNGATRYALGSVLNHVLLHQTVIGLEAKEQLALVGDEPDVVVGCVGGGSNFGGIALPFLRDKAAGRELRLVGAEPISCPTLTRGPFAYDFGDAAGLAPLLPMHTLGHDFVPPALHAGGLRYHGMAPIVSRLVRDELAEAVALPQRETFAAGLLFARAEGRIPAPETCHAIAAAIREARRAAAEGAPRTILFSFSGHGLVDMAAYASFLAGELDDEVAPSDEVLAASLEPLERLPRLPS
jgi:tryptophan synthase beta chain